MVTVGGDSHKRSHTLVAVDGNGRELDRTSVRATVEGHLMALHWASQWSERQWALEDCRAMTRGLERDLLGVGERVLRVAPKLMAGARRAGRGMGKSDPIDALATARAALREPDLPVAQLDLPTRELRLLLDHHDHLVGERTRLQNRVHAHLHELEPGLLSGGGLDSLKAQRAVLAVVSSRADLVASIAAELVTRIIQLTTRIKALHKEIASRVEAAVPILLALPGCGPLSAARLLVEAAGIQRFGSRACFAMFNGTAPIPAWSGDHVRFRLNRGGNRQANAAIHRIALTQRRQPGRGREYFERRLQGRDTPRDAMRALKRRISDEVFKRLLEDARTISQRPLATAA